MDHAIAKVKRLFRNVDMVRPKDWKQKGHKDQDRKERREEFLVVTRLCRLGSHVHNRSKSINNLTCLILVMGAGAFGYNQILFDTTATEHSKDCCDAFAFSRAIRSTSPVIPVAVPRSTVHLYHIVALGRTSWTIFKSTCEGATVCICSPKRIEKLSCNPHDRSCYLVTPEEYTYLFLIVMGLAKVK